MIGVLGTFSLQPNEVADTLSSVYMSTHQGIGLRRWAEEHGAMGASGGAQQSPMGTWPGHPPALAEGTARTKCLALTNWG